MRRGEARFALKLVTGGLWGSGRRLFEADLVTTTCTHPGARGSVPCIPATYVKGLLRTCAERVEHHMQRLGLVSGGDVERLFGPAAGRPGAGQDRPSALLVAHAFPVKEESVGALARGELFAYLLDESCLDAPEPYVEQHVRIDDAAGTALRGYLFGEQRVPPGTVMYGELEFRAESDEVLRRFARILAAAFAQWNYSYVGRLTSGRLVHLSIEPSDAFTERVVRAASGG